MLNRKVRLLLKRIPKPSALVSQVHVTPLVMETVVSILAGLFMMVWTMVLLSNDFYQLSLFTRLRNFLAGENSIKQNIKVIDIDSNSELKAAEKFQDPGRKIRLLAEGISLLGQYAALQHNKTIISGLDFVILQKPDNAEAKNEAEKGKYSFQERIFKQELGAMQVLAESVAKLPDNVHLVFGGALQVHDGGYTFLRQDIIYNFMNTLLHNEMQKKSGPSSANNWKQRFWMGNVHYLEGKLKSGMESIDDVNAAVCYLPLSNTAVEINKFYLAMPFIMFLLAEILEKQPDKLPYLHCHHVDGHYSFDNPEKWQAADNFLNGRALSDYAKESFYYNFHTNRDIKSFPLQYYSLQNYSSLFKPLSRPFFIAVKQKEIAQAAVLKKKTAGNKKDNKAESAVEFVFLAQCMSPVYLEEGSQDIIISPAASQNPFTQIAEPVSGVMTHICALENLLDNNFIRRGKSPLILIWFILILIFMTWSTAFLKLWKAALCLLGCFFFYMFGSFLLFCFFHSFYPVRSGLAIMLFFFSGLLLFRFVISLHNREVANLVLGRVMGRRSLEIFHRENKLDHLVKEGIVLVLFPKTFPEPDQSYQKIYQYYVNKSFYIIKHWGGHHDLLHHNGLAAYWLIEGKKSKTRQDLAACAESALMAALDFYRESPLMENYVRHQGSQEYQNYKSEYDIILHAGPFYRGVIQAGDGHDFVLSGKTLNQAIEQIFSQRNDDCSSLVLSRKFLKLIDHHKLEILEKEFHFNKKMLANFGEKDLYLRKEEEAK